MGLDHQCVDLSHTAECILQFAPLLVLLNAFGDVVNCGRKAIKPTMQETGEAQSLDVLAVADGSRV